MRAERPCEARIDKDSMPNERSSSSRRAMPQVDIGLNDQLFESVTPTTAGFRLSRQFS